MTKRGYLFALILIFFHIFSISIISLLMESVVESSQIEALEYVRLSTSIGYVFSLAFPVILLTQFKSNIFYKILGIQLISVGFLYVINVLIFDLYTYPIGAFIISVIGAVSMLVLAIYAFTKSDLKISGIFCLLAFLSGIVFSNAGYDILIIILKINDMSITEYVNRFSLAGFYFSFLILAASIAVVINASKNERRENVGLI